MSLLTKKNTKHNLPKNYFWANILTDEKKLTFLEGVSCYIWCTNNTACHEKKIITTVKHGGGSVIMWGWFAKENQFVTSCSSALGLCSRIMIQNNNRFTPNILLNQNPGSNLIEMLWHELKQANIPQMQLNLTILPRRVGPNFFTAMWQSHCQLQSQIVNRSCYSQGWHNKCNSMQFLNLLGISLNRTWL